MTRKKLVLFMLLLLPITATIAAVGEGKEELKRAYTAGYCAPVLCCLADKTKGVALATGTPLLLLSTGCLALGVAGESFKCLSSDTRGVPTAYLNGCCSCSTTALLFIRAPYSCFVTF